jgi:septation ring formation regulator EzrA
MRNTGPEEEVTGVTSEDVKAMSAEEAHALAETGRKIRAAEQREVHENRVRNAERDLEIHRDRLRATEEELKRLDAQTVEARREADAASAAYREAEERHNSANARHAELTDRQMATRGTLKSLRGAVAQAEQRLNETRRR